MGIYLYKIFIQNVSNDDKVPNLHALTLKPKSPTQTNTFCSLEVSYSLISTTNHNGRNWMRSRHTAWGSLNLIQQRLDHWLYRTRLHKFRTIHPLSLNFRINI